MQLEGWRADAVCSHELTDLWFDEDPAIEAAAITHCAVCPVKQECGEYASAYREEYGIWAGLRAYVPEEREILWSYPPAHIPNQLPETRY